MTATEPQYTILGLLGEGGFGRVYRARMEGAGGFSKDVAIKVLNEEEPTSATLERFRDESRMLALVRDRAIVRVDPPVQLGGRWAIVMEYVEGATCFDLLLRHRALPPKAAIEVTMEVARALGCVHEQQGPDGVPLELLHRDIKPGNLALTPSGEVKILDFGNARARFSTREAQTTMHVAGSIGFLAPERLSGVEHVSGDVFSLGATLRRLLSDRPVTDLPHQEIPEIVSADPDVRRALSLVQAMTQPDYTRRPSFREVEERCERLLRDTSGPSLRAWAQEHVRPAMGRLDDGLVGSVLANSNTLRPKEATSSARSVQLRRGVLFLGLGTIPLLGGLFLFVALALVVGGILYAGRSIEPDARTVPVAAAPPAPVAPEPVAPEPVAPEPVVPGPVPAAEPAPTAPVPRPPPAKAPEVAAAPKVLLDLGSVPLGATIFLDGARIGTTPAFGLAVPAGRHQLEMELAGARSRRAITVVPGEERRYIWKGGQEWSEVAR